MGREVDTDNQKWGDSLDKNKRYTLTLFFFSRKVTFLFIFQENRVFTFTALVLKRLNGNSSLRDYTRSQILDYFIVLFYFFYCNILFVVCFNKISFVRSNYQSLKFSDFFSLWAWVSFKQHKHEAFGIAWV